MAIGLFPSDLCGSTTSAAVVSAGSAVAERAVAAVSAVAASLAAASPPAPPPFPLVAHDGHEWLNPCLDLVLLDALALLGALFALLTVLCGAGSPSTFRPLLYRRSTTASGRWLTSSLGSGPSSSSVGGNSSGCTVSCSKLRVWIAVLVWGLCALALANIGLVAMAEAWTVATLVHLCTMAVSWCIVGIVQLYRPTATGWWPIRLTWLLIGLIAAVHLMGVLIFQNMMPLPDVILQLVSCSMWGLLGITSGAALIGIQSCRHGSRRQTLLANGGYGTLDLDSAGSESREQTASAWSHVTFAWMNHLFKLGLRRQLGFEDLDALANSDNTDYWSQLFQRNLVAETARRAPGLLHLFHMTFGTQWYALGALKLVSTAVSFVAPMLLQQILSCLQDNTCTLSTGVGWSLLLIVASAFSALLTTQLGFITSRVQLRIRSAIIAAVMSKAMTIDPAVRVGMSSGTITNLMSVDVQKIMDTALSFHQFWALPIQVAVTLYLLYSLVHWAFLAGLVVLLIFLPINMCISKRIGALTVDLMTYKDERVRLCTELLQAVRVVKMQAWEVPLGDRIRAARVLEMKFLSQRKYLDAICVYLWATTPVMVSLATFGAVVLVDTTAIGDSFLPPSSVFTTLTLLNMLIFPMNAFPWVVSGLLEARISARRLSKFLFAADAEPISRYAASSLRTQRPMPVLRINGSFGWPSTKLGGGFSLQSFQLDVQPGELILVCGAVGAGKSSLLSALLGAMPPNHGAFLSWAADTTVSYAPQTPWIRNATVKANILFGHEFRQQQYNAVLAACCMGPDLQGMPAGDNSEIGERGTNLSGGQKQRLALARALYAPSSVVILDDVTSALDATVAATVWSQAIGPTGLLGAQRRARIMATHDSKFVAQADRVIILKQGQVLAICPPSEITPELADAAGLVWGDVSSSSALTSMLNSSIVSQISTTSTGSGGITATPRMASGTLEAGRLTTVETRKEGLVSGRVVMSYVRAAGVTLVTVLMVSLFAMQLSRNASDWWLSMWSSDTGQGTFLGANHSNEWYLMILGFIAVANAVSTAFRSYLFAWGGIRAAVQHHTLLLAAILKAPLRFFDTTPVGRILNRFSFDQFSIDEQLPFMMNILLAQGIGLFGTLLVVAYSTRGIILLSVPFLGTMYYWVQKRYRATSRELKRLDSVSRSPIYSHFTECVSGVDVIRAFGKETQEVRECVSKVDLNQRACFMSNGGTQWLAFRLQCIGVAVVACLCALAVVERFFFSSQIVAMFGSVAGMAGLGLSYGLPIVSSLEGLISAFAETEKEMISVERQVEYQDAPFEEDSMFSLHEVPSRWPSAGRILIQDLTVQYANGMPPVLRNLNLELVHGEKIGIVGRTGAGKSSFILALWRLVPFSGRVLIDGASITDVPLVHLRRSLAIIPQDPVLFSGTVRYNLDPVTQHRDEELLRVLEQCHLRDSAGGGVGLEDVIDEEGRNWSVGQRQLLCLGRALLKNAKVLCVDEATSSVDSVTDHVIRSVIRHTFADATVITVAHRLSSVADVDRVMVLEGGKIVEFENPQVLIQRPGSMFASMWRQQQGNREAQSTSTMSK